MQQTNLKKPTFLFFRNHSLFHNFKNTDRKNLLLKPLLILFFLGIFSFSQGQQFTTYNTWNFEDMTLGVCNVDTLEKYFYLAEEPVYYTGEDLVHIVIDTINEQPTQVMQIKHRPNELWHGFGMRIWLTNQRTDFDEVYFTYNWKFSEEYNSTAGGKIPGLYGFPRDPDQGPTCPDPGYGFSAIMMYKRAGSLISYHYDRTPGHSICPWSTSDYNYDTTYMNNGCWYNVTQRVVMNTFTNGSPNEDGIKETWIDGRLLFQETGLVLMEDESDTMKIDVARIANFYGGGDDSYEPLTACWGYIDNITAWLPSDDSIIGHELHHPSTVLPTPDEITDRTVYYDALITTEGTLSNSEYGSNYSPCIDEAYLIDAGEGNTVELNITAGVIGGYDYLFFYDGNTTDADLIEKVDGYTSSFTGPRYSTGRYMFVRFSTDRDVGINGWTGTVTFSGTPNPPNAPTNLVLSDSTNTSISIAWTDNSNNETQFIIERSTGGAFTQIASVNANVTTYTNTGLTANTAYSYRVKASNGAGDSGYSNELLAHTTNTTGTATNVALNKTATQVSTAYGGEASRAVDGNTDGVWTNNSVTHTSGATNAWWEVDLGQDYQIDSIEVWNRTDACCMSRMDNYYVLVADTFTTTNLATTLGQGGVWSEHRTSFPNPTHYFTPNTTGHYVRIQLGDYDELNIAEVIVWSTTGGGSAPDAPSALHMVDSTNTSITIGWTDNSSNENGFVIERSLSSGTGFDSINNVGANVTNFTDTGLSQATTYYYRVKAYNSYGASGYSNELEAHTDDNTIVISNVALNKTATQSSTYAGGVASRAVDGNTDGAFSNGSVTHTASETNAWWQVDLGDDYQIDSIEVWNRTAYMDRLDNYYVMVADIFTSTSLSTALSESTWSEHRTTYPDTTHYFYPDTTGHYVRVQLGDTNSLSLAEVIVWGYDADLKEAILSKEINPGIEPEKPINVYPNPGSTMITISGFDQAIEIKIVDMLGKVIHLEGKVNNSTQIDVSNLKKGLYLILVKKENNIHITKFIKN